MDFFKKILNFLTFFAATSSRDDIHRRIGGHCSTENTKVIFKVFGGDESQQQQHKNAVTEVPTAHDKSHHHRNNFDWKDEDSSESTNSEIDESNKIHFSGDYDHATHRPFFINSNNVNNISGSKPTKKTSKLNFRLECAFRKIHTVNSLKFLQSNFCLNTFIYNYCNFS